VFDEEDGDAVVSSPRGKKHIRLIKSRTHHNSLKNKQPDAERVAAEPPRFSAVGSSGVLDGS
jgi:hypothetical protein